MEGSESYKRLVKHPQNGKIFLPINIDGLEETDHFMTMPKLVVLGILGVFLIIIIGSASQGGINLFAGLFSLVVINRPQYVIANEYYERKAIL